MGIRATGLGLAFLIIPSFFGASSILKMISSGLSFPGWLFFSAGLLMLGMAYLKRKAVPVTLAIVSPTNPATKADRENQELNPNNFQYSTTQANRPRDSRFGRNPVVSPNIQFGRATDNTIKNPPLKSSEWNEGVFAAIEWRRFEAVCEALFAQAGFKTKSQSHGADGGVDVWMYSAHAEGPVAIAQCKHWNGRQVGVKEMREFFGVMASHQLKRGTYATSSTYTEDARQFAKANGINAMDGARLLHQIATRTPEQQQDLLAIAYEGEYWRPTCASCGIKLVDRKPAKGGTPFWGCSNYPRCKTNLPMAGTAQKKVTHKGNQGQIPINLN